MEAGAIAAEPTPRWGVSHSTEPVSRNDPASTTSAMAGEDSGDPVGWSGSGDDRPARSTTEGAATVAGPAPCGEGDGMGPGRRSGDRGRDRISDSARASLRISREGTGPRGTVGPGGQGAAGRPAGTETAGERWRLSLSRSAWWFIREPVKWCGLFERSRTVGVIARPVSGSGLFEPAMGSGLSPAGSVAGASGGPERRPGGRDTGVRTGRPGWIPPAPA